MSAASPELAAPPSQRLLAWKQNLPRVSSALLRWWCCGIRGHADFPSGFDTAPAAGAFAAAVSAAITVTLAPSSRLAPPVHHDQAIDERQHRGRRVTIRHVRPSSHGFKRSTTSCSVRGSRSLVGSSSSKMRGLRRSARARTIVWRWPPDRPIPRSRTIVEPLGWTLNYPVERTRYTCGLDQCVVVRRRIGESDVGADGAVEEFGLLQGQARHSPEAPRDRAGIRDAPSISTRPISGRCRAWTSSASWTCPCRCRRRDRRVRPVIENETSSRTGGASFS